MFAYLLIIAELSILASVYWYVFIREPRPFEIKENIWGCYDSVNAGTGYGINGISSTMNQYGDESTRVRKVRRVVHTGHVLLKSARHGIKRKDIHRTTDLQSGWVQQNETKRTSALGSLLAFIGDTITKLSVKVS